MEAFFGGHAFDSHRHDCYAIGYTMQGVQSFSYRGTHIHSTPGCSIVIHPDERHDGHAGASMGFRYRMMYLQPALVRDALEGRAVSLPFLRGAITTDRRLRAALLPAFQDMTRTLEELERDHLIAMLSQALLALDGSSRAGRACNVPAAWRAREYLDAGFRQSVRSSELETITGADRYALARAFRQTFGTSPHRYLVQRRLDGVRSSLCAGASLAQAAADNGFADQSHMTRHFKAAYGQSPARWRALQSITSP